jgi:hypothetical protein
MLQKWVELRAAYLQPFQQVHNFPTRCTTVLNNAVVCELYTCCTYHSGTELLPMQPKLLTQMYKTRFCLTQSTDRPHYSSNRLTLSLLMSYIYGVLCKARNFNVLYIYGPTFGKAVSRLFLFVVLCFNTESMQKLFLCYSFV